MVRLLPIKASSSMMSKSGFNPTMVRLLLALDYIHPTQVARFNPTMVRLLLAFAVASLEEILRFNPTMVRLLPRQNFGV